MTSSSIVTHHRIRVYTLMYNTWVSLSLLHMGNKDRHCPIWIKYLDNKSWMCIFGTQCNKTCNKIKLKPVSALPCLVFTCDHTATHLSTMPLARDLYRIINIMHCTKKTHVFRPVYHTSVYVSLWNKFIFAFGSRRETTHLKTGFDVKGILWDCRWSPPSIFFPHMLIFFTEMHF